LKAHQKVVEQIKKLIEEKGLTEGEQLPSERDLSQALKVSRHTVREAVRRLEQQEILQTRPGSGTFVYKNIQHDFVLNSLANIVLHQDNEVKDVMEFRMMVEPQVVRLAAQNATKGDILYLEETLHRQNSAADSPESSRYDSEYHLGIARATGNMVLLAVIMNLNDIVNKYREGIYYSKERASCSYVGHLKILDAIRAKDQDEAEKTMKEHLTSIDNEILNQELN